MNPGENIDLVMKEGENLQQYVEVEQLVPFLSVGHACNSAYQSAAELVYERTQFEIDVPIAAAVLSATYPGRAISQMNYKLHAVLTDQNFRPGELL